MSRIIGVLNHKGGTGKTTTVVNLAAGLALRGHRVLCIDLDAQSGLAIYLNVQYNHSLANLLLNEVEIEHCIVPARENLDLIASDRELYEAEGKLWRMNNHHEAKHRLASKITGLEDYDFIFMDFSPSISFVGESGLLCIREIIVPVAMNYLALVGTRQVIETLKTVGQINNHNVKLSFVVPTFYRAMQRKDREVMSILRRYFGDRVTNPIRSDVKLSEAPSHGKTIQEYSPRSTGTSDYERLVERLLENG